MANIQIILGDFEKKLIMGLFIPVCIYISAFSFGQSDEKHYLCYR